MEQYYVLGCSSCGEVIEHTSQFKRGKHKVCGLCNTNCSDEEIDSMFWERVETSLIGYEIKTTH